MYQYFPAFMQLGWKDKHNIIFNSLGEIKVIFKFQASPSS